MNKAVKLSQLKTLLSPIINALGKKAESVNWNENNPEASGYINNKPFYEEADGTVHEMDEKFIPQELKAGRVVAGTTVTPYTIEELDYGTDTHRIEETPSDPVTAGEGAEVFNVYDGMNVASGAYSTAMGHHTIASGDYSIAQGRWATASGIAAKASGLLAYATGPYSNAEGTRTTATKNNAHAEGDSTQAMGNAAHSEGLETIASTNCAHAEGWKTKASGIASHAEGEGTIAAGRGQTAMGRYNVSDTTSKLIVGIGTKDTDRKNGFKVSSTGQGYFASDVYANDSKKLATEEFVNTSIGNKQDKITDALILTDTVTGAKYKLQIQNGQIITSLIEEE